MSTNTTPTIPSLLTEWEGMRPRNRDFALMQVLDGWSWSEEHGTWRNGRGCLVHFLPYYTSEDSPASLLKGVKAKVIERVGLKRWEEALFWVAGYVEPGNHSCDEYWSIIKRFTSDQDACACWIAKRMREG